MDIIWDESVTNASLIKSFLAGLEKYEGTITSLPTIIDGRVESTILHNYAHELRQKGEHLLIIIDSFEPSIHYSNFYSRFYDFKLANQISYCPYLENGLRQIFEQLGIQDTQSIERTNTEVSYGLPQNAFLNNCCVERINEAIQALYKALHLKESAKKLVEQIVKYILEFDYFIAFLRRLTAEAIRFQFLAFLIHNRLSRSPTPQKKEPPIGGVKIGGKQLDISCHVAEILYLKKTYRVG